MQLNFDASTVQPATAGGICFPLGDYPVEIVKTEGAQVKGDTNKGMLVLTLKTLAPVGEIPAGTEHAYRLNLFNDNETTVRIAYSQLSAVMHVIGRMQIQDTQQLVGGQFLAKIGPQKDNDKYSEIKSVSDFQGNQPGQVAHKPATPHAQTAPVAVKDVMQIQPAAPTAQAQAIPAFVAPTHAQVATSVWQAPAQAAAATQPPAYVNGASLPPAGDRPAWMK